MNLKTIKHDHIMASQLSESIANLFKDKITQEQYDVLKHNVYHLTNEDSVIDNYHGCGAGWVEIDKDGNAVNLKYFDEDTIGQDMEDYFIIEDQKHLEFCVNKGQESQNISMVRFDEETLMPVILDNGNMKLVVNFSCYELVRF